MRMLAALFRFLRGDEVTCCVSCGNEPPAEGDIMCSRCRELDAFQQ